MKASSEYDLALVIADLGSGGAQKVAMAMVNDLAAQNKRIAVITFSGTALDFHELPANVTRVTLDHCNQYKGLRANISRIKSLRAELKKRSPKNTLSFISPTNVITVWAGFGLPTKTIISERNDPKLQSFGKMWDALRWCSYRFANAVTANSENAVESLVRYVPRHKLHFTPNALAAPPQISDQKSKTILSIGRLHHQKNHSVLLQAFAKLRGANSDWNLVIAGEGELETQLKSQAKTLGIDNAVIFSGTVKNPYALYKNASIFVLASLHEGTPNALLEAMSCKLAPIISDTCIGAITYITHNESGLIVPVNNVDMLAQAFIKLIDNEAYRKDIGSAAQKSVSHLYNKNTLDIWGDIINL